MCVVGVVLSLIVIVAVCVRDWCCCGRCLCAVVAAVLAFACGC